ncbi:hypothetical protein SL053_002088 [Flavobacterium psychrophilum]|jgi:hypothetical protein|uniref:hypothetical protein n=1 Tax=Flavobacterium psychrophilum TaxID=96345 RepID=UPI000B7C2A73|nr:hypothetical protein [Flavobacterium psychrophilum]EKT3956729.1 hypothetical protein [Flavobacterium psychrophilum]EKT3964026.1 hypothetical protein [Flavobacterium psychrophilum]EKT4501954.1 hypothetical protein [Flavobacterium psychrophilum]EKT4517402.1 hypothetical protein [Flavobacterium psychrophilum]ELY2018171.1 hypothetical protein [Flavobacterium psychrophilum]
MQKEIKYSKGTLIIGYCENLQDISVFETDMYLEPIRVTFVPNIEMNEEECSKYTSENLDNIIQETKAVIYENFEFYNNFEITFNNEFTGYSLYRHHLNRDLLIVSKSTMNVNCKLIESILQ